MSFEKDRAALLAARDTIAALTITVTEEAARRNETWRAKVWYMGSHRVDHYLTLAEACKGMEGDHWIEWVQAPDGTPLDKHTLEPLLAAIPAAEEEKA